MHVAPESNTKPLLEHLQTTMPHWTPKSPDKIVYTTVDEAHSSSMVDVGRFLKKLKDDLCIGTEGYPSYVVVGEDQQTYAIMINLKIRYQGRYDWLYPVPGDWHIMKNSAEVIRNVILDGGYSEFAKMCGHKGKEIKQWQDIHNILIAIYEALLKDSVSRYL